MAESENLQLILRLVSLFNYIQYFHCTPSSRKRVNQLFLFKENPV